MSYHTPKHSISIPENSSLETIHSTIESGGQFVVFLYCFSFLVFSFRRFSKAILIENNEALENHKIKYNRISYLFGWWAVPYGIGNTLACIKLNKQGGINVSEDIMLNISEESLKSGVVVLKEVNTIFAHPEDDELKMLQKVFSEKLDRSAQVNELIIGYFLNLDIDEYPFYAVGIKTSGDFDRVKDQVEKAIRTIFFKQTEFQFFNLENEELFIEKLKEQGKRFI